MDKLTDFNYGKADKITRTSVRVKSVHKSLQDTFKSSDTNSNNSVPSHKTVVRASTKQDENDNPFNFVVGSAVKHFEKYGVIKWIGTFLGDRKLYAKIELEDSGTSGHDGIWRGVKYKQNKERFTFLGQLKPDQRTKNEASPVAGSFSQISDQPNDIDESHKGAAFAASNSPTNTCNIREKSSQASSQSNDVDTSHKEAIISDDGVEVVDTSPQNIEHEDINPHNLIVGSVIEYDEPVQHACGEIRWIGKLPSETQTYAGVEMDDDICEDPDDGVWEGIEYYKCRPGRGLFVQLSALKPGRRLMAVVLQNPHNFGVETTVRYGEPARYGVIKWMGILPGDQKMAYAGLEMDEQIEEEEEANDGVWKGERYYDCEPNRGRFVPLIDLKPCNEGNRKGSADNILLICANETNATKDHPLLLRQSSLESVRCADNKSQHILSKLETGSLVQFGNPVQYGVIKRMETAADTLVEMAEVETENNQLKKIPLAELQPDNRFIVDVNRIEGNINPLEKEHYKHDEEASHVPPDKKLNKHKHTCTKGIQGYKNSCYLDATLYGMFTFSDAFDILLMEKATTNAEELHLQNILRSEIVYPLRKKGIVVQEPVAGFREYLAKLQDMKGLTSEEKDPEEFLNLLFKHVLHIEPFITIRRPSGIDEEFFVQLFVEPDKDKPAVNTQTLLSKMFQEQNITFTKSPTKLLLQMPRYGKSFKSFQRIIPSLKLNVTSLCMTTGLCSVCQQQTGYVCNNCSRCQKRELQFYCNTCSAQWHQNSCDHKHELNNSDFDTGTLQLLSVLCIETSHYVCFTRIIGSSGKDEWVFFDSMAERQDNGYNLPKVTHCTDQMHKFVYGKKDIGKIPSKNLPELVRRFVEDAYLCIYTAKHTEAHRSAGIKR